jgi:hypothetical protein
VNSARAIQFRQWVRHPATSQAVWSSRSAQHRQRSPPKSLGSSPRNARQSAGIIPKSSVIDLNNAYKYYILYLADMFR